MKIARFTDLFNAECFVADHRDRLRFVATWGKWLVFDGKRWTQDESGRAFDLAKRTVRGGYTKASDECRAAQEALTRAGEDEELRDVAAKRLNEAQLLYTWAKRSHDASRIRDMVSLAKSAPELALVHGQLDADPWALNVANGTLDLRTGELRPHDPRDLVTKLAPVVFDPRATCPTWEAFVSRAMGGSAELVAYLRRLTGYSLTGVIREHVLAFCFGSGANGKSTFLNALHEALGDYSGRAPRTLLFRSRGERHETELTTLFSARFVVCPEVAEDADFDEALVKDLTGGDPITARRMREDFWSFAPTHKLWIAGNHLPRVRGSDEGIWRRIRLIPWTVTIPREERDATLPEKLRAELPGILNWAVRGCLEWQAEGLGDPLAVTQATAGYREQSDPLREFFDWACVFHADARMPRARLRETYEHWCEEIGAEPLGARRFANGLAARAVTGGPIRCAGKVVNGWRGVRLTTDEEREKRAKEREGANGVGSVGTCNAESGLISIGEGSRREETGKSTYEVPTLPTDGAEEPLGEPEALEAGSEEPRELFGTWLAAEGIRR